jgi:putative ABC transport system permease protein
MMLSSFRMAFRGLLQSPAFSIVCVLTLALGIGANTAMFSVIDSLLLRRLPFSQPEQLVRLMFSVPKRGILGSPGMSLRAYEYYRDHSHAFTEVAAYDGESLNITGGKEPEELRAARVSFNYFHALGIQPLLGRNFLPEEDGPGGKPVAILSQALWQRRFAGDMNVIGKTFLLNDTAYTVIGVMPAGFEMPAREFSLWVTNLAGFTTFTPEQIRGGAGYLQLVARLRPDVTIASATSELSILISQYGRDDPRRTDADPDARMRVTPLADAEVEGFRTELLVLFAAVGFVLLIACANVAALLLARGASRTREIAIRAALGASRRQLISHLLAESVVLSFAGGAAGLLTALWGTALLERAAQSGFPEIRQVHWDVRVLLFAIGVSIATGLVFGLIPSLHISTPDLNSTLREGGRASAGSASRHRLRSFLVIGQVALSIVLLIGAGLLLRSFVALHQIDPGFDPRNVLTLHVRLGSARYATDDQRSHLLQRATQAIASVPGVRSAAAALGRPMSGPGVMAPVLRATDPIVPYAQRTIVAWQSATPGYFETMRTRLLRGRTFTERDGLSAQPVAIVNETLAKLLWPASDPIGQRLLVARIEVPWEVVGVIHDLKAPAVASNGGSGGEVYTPYDQRTWPSVNIIVRSDVDPTLISNAVRARLLEIDPDQPVTHVETVDQIVAESFGQRRLTLWLIGGFAAVALILALIGLYGVIAYSVAQRTREMGIRHALGASFSQICGMVLGQGLKLVAIGVFAGIAGAFGVTRLISGLLFRVQATDPAVFAAAAVLFAVVALLASYVPARRAAKVDPVITLRNE